MKDIRNFIKKTLSENLQSIEKEVEPKNFKKENGELLSNNVKEFYNYIVNDIPEYYLKEVGISIILDFLIVEDGMNFRLQHGISTPGTIIFKSPEPKSEEESEIDYILRINKVPYSWKEIKNRLVQYFVRRLMANVPSDKLFKNKEEMWNFIKTYEQAFIYNYMIPMAKNAK